MTEQLDGQMSFFDQDSQYGRTSRELSAVTKGKTFRPLSKRSAMSANPVFLFLNLTRESGSLLGLSWEMVGALPGESMTLNFGESPSEERGSTLSQILDLQAPEKYSLSPRACAGILRRAEKRGKTLPDMLRDALMEVVGSDGSFEMSQSVGLPEQKTVHD